MHEHDGKTSTARQLVGTWQLVSIRFEYADTREAVEMYGPDPLGFMILTENGRMMAIMTASGRSPPSKGSDRAALFDSVMAYAGTYRLEGQHQFITTAEVTWHPTWHATEQPRFFKLSGDTLAITIAEQTHPLYPGAMGRGVLEFQAWR